MPAIKLKKVTAEYLAEKEKGIEKEKVKSKKNLEEVVAGEEDAEEEVKPYNFLDVEVLWDKRKRTVPAAEQKLIDWLDANLESKPDVNLPLLKLYEYYSEVCQMQGSSVVDVPVFNRYIRDKFGKCFGFQENSPYRVLLKERKPKEKKPKVEGETGQLKIRDIICEVIGNAGNPSKGLRFVTISKAILQKYPAHKIGLTSKKLKAALERGIYYGHYVLVRGVGMCGYYRLPGKPTIEEEEPEKAKAEVKSEEKDESVENGTEEVIEGDQNEKGGMKRKADSEESAEAAPKKKQKKKSKEKKKKPSEKVYRSEVEKHSDPQKVEDAFPLAITYQSDPKECSASKIKQYISKYYHVDVNPEKLKKALESGVEKGLWELTRGSGTHGTYHLLIETFNPARSDSLSDQIAQALVACHEPKCASVSLIKKYITKYHPHLNIDTKPHLFKSALMRAISKGTIRQLSGVGASGSFQLVYQFFPSPAILAGDTSDDEEEVEDEDEDEDPVEYVPRPTKRGRIAKRKAPSSATNASSKSKSASASTAKGKAKAKPPAKAGKKKQKIEYNESEDEEIENEVEEYTPRKSKSRGGGSDTTGSRSSGKTQKTTGKQVSLAKKTPAEKGGKSIKKSSQKSAGKAKASTPAGKASKATPPSTKQTKQEKNSPQKESSAKRKLIEESEDEPISDQEEYVPKPTKRRSGLSMSEEDLAKTSVKKSTGKSKRK